MNSMSDYPDDIRRYDDDPRSPFYDEDRAERESHKQDMLDEKADADYERYIEERLYEQD